MDSVDVCAATSTADSNKRCVHKRNRDWLNHLRKAGLQPAAMQTPDKLGPKKIVATEERASTTWPPSKKRPNHEELQRAIHGANSLRFKCSQCTDSIERAPKDLLKHFDEKHKGCPPVFSCHMCKFTTHEFSYLQVHILSHKDTFSCCSLCKDNVQRSWAEFSAHLTMVHTQNGKYMCEVCKKFSTADDKEFLEHVLLHNLGLDMKNEQGIIGNVTTYKCQYCGYEASQKILLTKHVKAIHGSVNCNQRNTDVSAFSELKGKPRMTRSAVKDISWLTQDCLSLSGREFLDKYCHLSDTKTTLEETEQFLMKSGKQRWSKALKNVLSNVPQDVNLQSKLENGFVSVSPDSSQDVLLVKNKMNQNGGSFTKRLKLMTEKEVESADADSCEKIANDASLSSCLQNQEMKLSSDVLIAKPKEGPPTEENRENHRLKTHLNKCNIEEAKPDGSISNERKVEERKAARKALPKKKRKNMRWRNMKKKSNRADRCQTALALKLILKKNPKMGKRWFTQTSKTAPTQSKSNSTIEEMKKCNKTDVCRGEGTTLDKNETTDCVVEKQAESIQDGGYSIEDVDSVLVDEKSQDKSEVGAHLGGSAEDLKSPPDGSTEASALAQPVITAHSHAAVCPPLPVARTQEALTTDSSLRSSSASDSSPSPPPRPPLTSTSASKTLERTLHLAPFRPDQLVKRPVGSQPVVVLNHPDVDIQEVTRIMDVVKKYKGQIHKVVLSKRTLHVIDGRGRLPDIDSDAPKIPIRERFLLKLKLRRLSKKRFEVINDDASSNQTFRCWFCGRVFENREVWLSHRQRHLLEWKTPNCESS